MVVELVPVKHEHGSEPAVSDHLAVTLVAVVDPAAFLAILQTRESAHKTNWVKTAPADLVAVPKHGASAAFHERCLGLAFVTAVTGHLASPKGVLANAVAEGKKVGELGGNDLFPTTRSLELPVANDM